MARLHIVFLASFFLCGFGSAGFAQDTLDSIHVDRPATVPSKGRASKNIHKDKNVSTKAVKPTPEEADKAARMEAERKRFFGESIGFDHGEDSKKNPLSLGGSGGLSPGMNFKF